LRDRAVLAAERLARLQQVFEGRVHVEIQRQRIRGEARLNQTLVDLASQLRLPLIATNCPAYARPGGRELLDVFTCIREHVRLDTAGRLLEQNAERHLKPAAQMRELFCDLPDAVANSGRLAAELDFSLENLGYEFPRYDTLDGMSMEDFLERVTWEGARERYGPAFLRKCRRNCAKSWIS